MLFIYFIYGLWQHGWDFYAKYRWSKYPKKKKTRGNKFLKLFNIC